MGHAVLTLAAIATVLEIGSLLLCLAKSLHLFPKTTAQDVVQRNRPLLIAKSLIVLGCVLINTGAVLIVFQPQLVICYLQLALPILGFSLVTGPLIAILVRVFQMAWLSKQIYSRGALAAEISIQAPRHEKFIVWFGLGYAAINTAVLAVWFGVDSFTVILIDKVNVYFDYTLDAYVNIQIQLCATSFGQPVLLALALIQLVMLAICTLLAHKTRKITAVKGLAVSSTELKFFRLGVGNLLVIEIAALAIVFLLAGYGSGVQHIATAFALLTVSILVLIFVLFPFIAKLGYSKKQHRVTSFGLQRITSENQLQR
jgi:hypothetical protein